jgi:hypothetical protein
MLLKLLDNMQSATQVCNDAGARCRCKAAMLPASLQDIMLCCVDHPAVNTPLLLPRSTA